MAHGSRCGSDEHRIPGRKPHEATQSSTGCCDHSPKPRLLDCRSSGSSGRPITFLLENPLGHRSHRISCRTCKRRGLRRGRIGQESLLGIFLDVVQIVFFVVRHLEEQKRDGGASEHGDFVLSSYFRWVRKGGIRPAENTYLQSCSSRQPSELGWGEGVCE
jgi:hypothetical protein